jgi:excisionase family DNA binding protein
MNDELLTATELSAKLRVTPETVRRWCREGRIPAYRASGRPILFCLTDVLKALATAEDGEEEPMDRTRGPPLSAGCPFRETIQQRGQMKC